MATPRKHWFKCPDSVADEDWTNDQLATLIRLQSRLNTRWARNGLGGEDAGRITLTAGDAIAVTHRSSFARAALLLRACSACASLTVRVERASVIIEWPKWPEFQGLHSRELPESRPLRDSDSDSDARRKTEPPKPPSPAAPVPPAPRARRLRRRLVDPRSQEAWDAIRAAFSEHGTELGSNLGLDRSDLIAKRLDEGVTPEDLVAAVHGYVRQNGLEPRGDFDPRRFFRPQTVFKAEGFSDRVDAGKGPRPVGSGVSNAAKLWGLR